MGGLVYGVGEVSLTEGNIHILDGAPVVPVSSSGHVPTGQEPDVGRPPVHAPGSWQRAALTDPGS